MATKTVPRNVTETINYQYEDGTTASPSVTKTVTFNKTITYDPTVTGSEKVWSESDWDAASRTFDDVASPEIAGYTADQTTVTGATVTPTSTNITKTVTYKANACSLTLEIVDADDSNKVLDSMIINGNTSTTMSKENLNNNYQTTLQKIAHYENLSIDSASQTELDKGYTFSADSNQTVKVLVHHKTMTQHPTQQAARHVFNSLEGQSGSTLQINQPYKFHYDETYDLFTNKPVKDTNFIYDTKIDSVTAKAYDGYTVTNPDAAPALTLEQLVTVKDGLANNKQPADVTFKYVLNSYTNSYKFVDADGTAIHAELAGKLTKYTQSVDLTDVNKVIDDLVASGYKVTSNPLTTGMAQVLNGKTYTIKFDHQTSTSVETATATLKVHYTGAGDKTLLDSVEDVNISRTHTIDEVTKTDTSTAWVPAKSTYNTVYNPVVSGYVITNVDNNGSTDGGKTVSGVAVGDKSKTITVTYQAVGKYVPVMQLNGLPVYGYEQAQGLTSATDHSWSYTNDPTDPTKVTASPIAPTIDGWTQVSALPTTITNPTEDTNVSYSQNTINDKIIYTLNGTQFSTANVPVQYLTQLKDLASDANVQSNAPSGYEVATIDKSNLPSDGLQGTKPLTITATLVPVSGTASFVALASSTRATTNQTNSSVD